MKKLNEDVEILKSMGCITIAEQYKRMAKALMKIREYSDRPDFLIHLSHINNRADAALKRFK